MKPIDAIVLSVVVSAGAGLAAAQVAGQVAPQAAEQAAPQEQPPLPTMVDLKQLYESGDYRTCLQQVSRLLQRRADNANAAPRDQLLLLRGQCLLAMQDPATALRALDQAKESPDQQVALEAHALSALIRKSPNMRYVPKSGAKLAAGGTQANEGIDIADPKSRKQAFAAFVEDEYDSLQADTKKAIAADNLNPTIALVPRLVELSTAERVATGDNPRTGPIGKELGEHARGLIESELELQDRKIAGVERFANRLLSTGRWGITRQGLNSDQRQELWDQIQYLKRIVETSQQGLHVAHAIGGNTAAWEAIVARAQAVRDHAQNVLDAEGFRSGSGDTSGIGKNG